MNRCVYVLGLAAILACGEHRRQVTRDIPHDAARVVVDHPVASQISDLGDNHLDEDVPRVVTGSASPARPPRPIDVTLQSTPAGAQVLVDGQFIGTTPTFWNGEADGHEHEFVFMRRGHATARYRFVPVTSGVIHARLERISEEPDAGVDDGTAPLPGVPLPGTGSMLVNPPPAPVTVPRSDATSGSAESPPSRSEPATGAGPQP